MEHAFPFLLKITTFKSFILLSSSVNEYKLQIQMFPILPRVQYGNRKDFQLALVQYECGAPPTALNVLKDKARGSFSFVPHGAPNMELTNDPATHPIANAIKAQHCPRRGGDSKLSMTVPVLKGIIIKSNLYLDSNSDVN